jgi:hypothetical protein
MSTQHQVLAGGGAVATAVHWLSLTLLNGPVMSRQRTIGTLTPRAYLLFAFVLGELRVWHSQSESANLRIVVEPTLEVK